MIAYPVSVKIYSHVDFTNTLRLFKFVGLGRSWMTRNCCFVSSNYRIINSYFYLLIAYHFLGAFALFTAHTFKTLSFKAIHETSVIQKVCLRIKLKQYSFNLISRLVWIPRFFAPFLIMTIRVNFKSSVEVFSSHIGHIPLRKLFHGGTSRNFPLGGGINQEECSTKLQCNKTKKIAWRKIVLPSI